MDNSQNCSFDANDPGDIEHCVLCGKQTGYKRSDPIGLRQYYIEGAGQLCKKCFLTLMVEECGV